MVTLTRQPRVLGGAKLMFSTRERTCAFQHTSHSFCHHKNKDASFLSGRESHPMTCYLFATPHTEKSSSQSGEGTLWTRRISWSCIHVVDQPGLLSCGAEELQYIADVRRVIKNNIRYIPYNYLCTDTRSKPKRNRTEGVSLRRAATEQPQ